jgi:hypothetical protein
MNTVHRLLHRHSGRLDCRWQELGETVVLFCASIVAA